MNNKKAKKLRRQAEVKVYDWYKSLLPEDQQDLLTPEMALEFTPRVQYWNEYHELFTVHGTPDTYTSKQTRVSDHTIRWFYLQEKKYARAS